MGKPFGKPKTDSVENILDGKDQRDRSKSQSSESSLTDSKYSDASKGKSKRKRTLSDQSKMFVSEEMREKYKDDKQDDFEFFWQPRDILSQWFPCKFNIDGVDYNCAEQYMMQQKALLFGDTVTADVIMALKEPREQKHLARRVNKDEDLWNDCCRDVVKRGNIAKFSQNKGLKMILFSTYPKILAEASPYDTKWGIGLKADDPRAWNRATWQGRNYLGRVLMEVREELMKDDGIL